MLLLAHRGGQGEMVMCSDSGHQIAANRDHAVKTRKGIGPTAGPDAAAVKVALSVKCKT